MYEDTHAELNRNPDYVKLANVYSVCRQNKTRSDTKLYDPLKITGTTVRDVRDALVAGNRVDYDLVFRQIFANDGKIDYQLPADSPSKFHSPELLGCTALHFAVASNNPSILDSLLRLGADPTLRDSRGFTALRLSLESSYGRGRDCASLKGTLLHPLASSILDAQVAAGNPTNPRCNDGVTHLHIACMLDHAEAVKFFVKNGASVDEAVSSGSRILAGYTPLHFAARYCSLDAIKILLAHRANRRSTDAKWTTPLHTLVDFKIQLTDAAREKNWKSFDWLRIDLGRIDQAIELLTAGIEDPSAVVDDTGLTLFHVVCVAKGKPIVERYLDRVEDVDAAIKLDSPFRPGYTALHFAAHFDVQTFLLLMNRCKADVLAEDADGVTPLDICFGRHGINDVYAIFSAHELLRELSLSNDDKLAYVLGLMRDRTLFQIYAGGTIDEEPRVPRNSPIWPGFNLLHIAVALSRFVQFPQFDDVDHSETTFPAKLEDERVGVCLDHEVDHTAQDALHLASPLHLAFRQHKRDVVSKIAGNLQRGRWRDPVDSRGLSHTHLLLCANEFGAAKSLHSWCGRCANLRGQIASGISWQEMRYADFNEISRVPAGSTALHTAVILGSEEMVEWTLHQGLDPSAKNHDGMTPLHLVVFRDDNLASLMLKHGKPWQENVASSGGLSNFHVACYLSNIEAMRAYLELGVDVNLPIVHGYRRHRRRLHPSAEVGYTPLHFAIEGCSLEAVKLLLERGADVGARGVDGLTPLYLALRNASNVVPYFLATMRESGYVDEMGLTTLHIACACCDERAVARLLSEGADPRARVQSESPIFPGYTALRVLTSSASLEDEQARNIARRLLESEVGDDPGEAASAAIETDPRTSSSLSPVDREGVSHLHLAVRAGEHVDCRRIVQRYRLDVDRAKDHFCRDEGGYTALHYATESGVTIAIEALLEHGADVNARDQSGASPLHAIAKQENDPNFRNKTKLLLRAGKADPNARDLLGRSPLEALIDSGFRPATMVRGLQTLLAHGGRINVYNPVTSRALTNALLRTLGRGKSFQSVLSKAADLFLDADTGRTAIHNVVSTRHDDGDDEEDWTENYVAAIRDIMRRGVRINAQDYRGKTPLHVAVEFPNRHAIKALLTLGADVNVADSEGLTPFYHSRDGELWRTFERHLRQLLLVGLDVERSNRALLDELSADEAYRVDKACLQELSEMREVPVYGSFTLRDLLSERAIADYPAMPRSQRQDIDRLQRNCERSLKEFGQLGYLVNLQHAKALDRMRMLQAAKDVVWTLMGTEMPEPCVENILRFFSNVEMRALLKWQ